jgi:hypothetical protein
MTPLFLGLLLAALLATDTFAEPPTGFAEFPWGTSAQVVKTELLAKRCRSTSESRRGWYSLQCNDYQVEGLSVPILRLDFEPDDSLAGYSMNLARGSYRRFRDLSVQRFGAPTTQRRLPWQGAVLSWRSASVTATLTEDCGPDASCMEVTTPALERRRQAFIDRQKRDASQSF